MSNSTVNYTPEMVAILEQNAPIDYAKAQELSTQLDRGVRSIIAKCKREGIEYIIHDFFLISESEKPIMLERLSTIKL